MALPPCVQVGESQLPTKKASGGGQYEVLRNDGVGCVVLSALGWGEGVSCWSSCWEWASLEGEGAGGSHGD